MSKILTIIRREYLTRVRSKAFVLSTLLLPLGLVLLIVLPILASKTVQEEKVTVFVADPSGLILPNLESKGGFTFLEAKQGPDKSIAALESGEIYLSLDSASLKTQMPLAAQTASEKLSLQVEMGLKKELKNAIRKYKTQQLGLTLTQYESLNQFNVLIQKKGPSGDEGGAKVAAIVGYAMAFLIYIMMIMYGMFVMRGVIEEKTNRIVEVIISSVKPFQLMLGKLLGICAVGVTQLLLWIGLVFVLMQVAGGLLVNTEVGGMAGGAGGPSISAIISMAMATLNPGLILLFIFFFLGGFLIYGSLFAAVGSAVDQETDAQQFVFPVLLPLILPMALLGNIIQNPNGTLSVFMSHFPLTSPTVMMVRLSSTDVPWYELLGSIVFLLIGIVFFVWLASRIYRVGILMYGKKPSFREISKWIFRS